MAAYLLIIYSILVPNSEASPTKSAIRWAVDRGKLQRVTTIVGLILSLLSCSAFPEHIEDPKELANAGEKLLKAGQTGKAQALFERALALDPDQFTAGDNLGLLHYSKDQFAQAEHYLQRAAQSNPRSFQARFLLGATLVRLNPG